jgi:hypothetical protein
LICGVIWTLTFEWAFYLLLPLTGRLATPRLVWILAVPSFALAAFYPVAALLLCFIFGMLAAHLVRRVDLRPIASQIWFGVVPLALIAAVVKFTAPYPYLSPLAALLLAIAMLAFLYGCDLFGLLRTRGARLLSAASYSIYLLHGLVLYVTLRLIGRNWGLERMEAPRYWLLVSGNGRVAGRRFGRFLRSRGAPVHRTAVGRGVCETATGRAAVRTSPGGAPDSAGARDHRLSKPLTSCDASFFAAGLFINACGFCTSDLTSSVPSYITGTLIPPMTSFTTLPAPPLNFRLPVSEYGTVPPRLTIVCSAASRFSYDSRRGNFAVSEPLAGSRRSV